MYGSRKPIRIRQSVQASKTIALLVLLIPLLLILPPILRTQEREVASLANTDPSLLDAIIRGEKPVAYAIISPDRMQYLPPPLKAWRFGDKLILKYRMDIALLRRVSKHAYYISMPRSFTIIDPIGLLRRATAEELMNDLERAKEYHTDIKRSFHRASDRWGGKGVTVCVIDSGVDYLHPDLRDSVRVLVSLRVYGNDHPLIWIKGVNGTLEDAWVYEQGINNTYGVFAWMDKFGHGTHVSGIIAGSGVASRGEVLGIAPNVTLVVIKAFGDNGTASMDTILEALDWVQRHMADFNITIVNMSFGAYVPSNGKDPVSVACDELAELGLILFASAGNNYIFPFTISSPASAHKVIAVGAVNPYTCKIPSWTACGPTNDGRMKPDFICAGVWVLSTKPVTVKSYIEEAIPEAVRDNYYMWLSGTSMACPIAVGLCAEWVEYYYYVYHEVPSWRKAYSLLTSNIKRLNPFFKDFISGEGIPYGPGG